MSVQVTAIGEWMTLREAARVKRCTETALYQQVRQKGLNHIRIGRQIMVRVSDLVSYTPRSA